MKSLIALFLLVACSTSGANLERAATTAIQSPQLGEQCVIHEGKTVCIMEESAFVVLILAAMQTGGMMACESGADGSH